jgi:hypothetical protein
VDCGLAHIIGAAVYTPAGSALATVRMSEQVEAASSYGDCHEPLQREVTPLKNLKTISHLNHKVSDLVHPEEPSKNLAHRHALEWPT